MLDEPICPNCGHHLGGECVTINGARYCSETCAAGEECACPLPTGEARRELAGALNRGHGDAARDNMTSG